MYSTEYAWCQWIKIIIRYKPTKLNLICNWMHIEHYSQVKKYLVHRQSISFNLESWKQSGKRKAQRKMPSAVIMSCWFRSSSVAPALCDWHCLQRELSSQNLQKNPTLQVESHDGEQPLIHIQWQKNWLQIPHQSDNDEDLPLSEVRLLKGYRAQCDFLVLVNENISLLSIDSRNKDWSVFIKN